MAKQVAINEEECVGCETCVELCPDIFAFDNDAEKAHVIKAEGGDEDCIEEAIGSCPAECISYE
jgi:ferredoxin